MSDNMDGIVTGQAVDWQHLDGHDEQTDEYRWTAVRCRLMTKEERNVKKTVDGDVMGK